jgi:hypothetical protein
MDKSTVPEKYREYYLSMEHNAKVPGLTAESAEFILCKSGLHCTKQGTVADTNQLFISRT